MLYCFSQEQAFATVAPLLDKAFSTLCYDDNEIHMFKIVIKWAMFLRNTGMGDSWLYPELYNKTT